MSTNEQRRPAPLSETGIRQLVKVALDRGYYRESFHAEIEHTERHISFDDMLYGLERPNWILEKPPDYDEKHRSWEYLIKTVDIEGDELHIKIAAYPAEKRFEVISRW